MNDGSEKEFAKGNRFSGWKRLLGGRRRTRLLSERLGPYSAVRRNKLQGSRVGLDASTQVLWNRQRFVAEWCGLPEAFSLFV